MSCPNLKPYNEVRMEKLKKINNYHKLDDNSLLNKFQTFTGITDNEVTMKRNYKEQLDNLNKEMLSILNNDVNLLIEQHIELESKTKEVDSNDELLKNIKTKIEQESITSNARLKNSNEMISLEHDYRFYHNLLFYGNILTLLLIIVIIGYIYVKY